ncbi:MAG: hypothetical protein FWE33_02100 [Defluviitaleaceae bacterium]|nr:hypothetical protein [Defluviitaleaceae bacterium]
MKNWDEVLSLYIDDVLDEKQKADVEKELAASAVVRVKYENLLIVTQTLNTLSEVDLPEGLADRILWNTTAKHTQKAKSRKAQWITRIASYGTVAAAALLFGFYFGINRDDSGLYTPEADEYSSIEMTASLDISEDAEFGGFEPIGVRLFSDENFEYVTDAEIQAEARTLVAPVTANVQMTALSNEITFFVNDIQEAINFFALTFDGFQIVSQRGDAFATVEVPAEDNGTLLIHLMKIE